MYHLPSSLYQLTLGLTYRMCWKDHVLFELEESALHMLWTLSEHVGLGCSCRELGPMDAEKGSKGQNRTKDGSHIQRF